MWIKVSKFYCQRNGKGNQKTTEISLIFFSYILMDKILSLFKLIQEV